MLLESSCWATIRQSRTSRRISKWTAKAATTLSKYLPLLHKSQTLLCQNAAQSAHLAWCPKLRFLNSNLKSIPTFCTLEINPKPAVETICIIYSRSPTSYPRVRLKKFRRPNQNTIWRNLRFEVRLKAEIALDLLLLIQNKVNNSDKH